MSETRPRPTNHEIRQAIVDDLEAEGISFPLSTVEAWQEDLLRMGFSEGDVMVRLAHVTKLAARERIRLEEAVARTCDELVLSVIAARWCADPPRWSEEQEAELDPRISAESVVVTASVGGNVELDAEILRAARKCARYHDQRDIRDSLAPALRISQAKAAAHGGDLVRHYSTSLAEIMGNGSFRARSAACVIQSVDVFRDLAAGEANEGGGAT